MSAGPLPGCDAALRLLNKIAILSDKEVAMSRKDQYPGPNAPGLMEDQPAFVLGKDAEQAAPHVRQVMLHAESAGLLSGEKSERLSGRVTPELLSAAKAKTGLESPTQLLEYALSKVAIEDDYGSKLLRLKGSIPDDVAL
jgi:hypothetical protein